MGAYCKTSVGSHEIGQTSEEQARYKPPGSSVEEIARAGFDSVSLETVADRSLRPLTPPARDYGGYDRFDYEDGEY